MIKNRTTQLIFQTIYCTIGLVGLVACLGVFEDVSNLRWDFYVHFTNLSNFLCIGVLLWMLILFVAFVGVGFIFFGLDKLLGKKKKEGEDAVC